VLGFEVRGDEYLDAELERFRERVSEHIPGNRVPQDYLLGLRISDDNRGQGLLEEPADAQVFWSHVI